MDQNGCINTDTSRVYVIESIDSIVFERPVACFNENEFTIIGANASDSIGRFKLIPNIDSIITSVDTNQITLDPSKLKLDSDLDIQVIYTYTDLSGFELTVERTLHIEQLHEASINPIAEDEYCANYNAIDLGGFYGTQGIFGGTGVTGDSSQGYGFDPALADLGINRITYYYTSNNACRIGDSTVLIVYDAPVADFDIVDDCTPESGGTVIFNNNTYTGVSNQINWEWEFGDFINSGALNFSTNMAPTHFYKEQGTWTVDLEVTIDHGCYDAIQKQIVLHANPVAQFNWNSNCISDEPITLEGNEIIYNGDEVADRNWTFTVNGKKFTPTNTDRIQNYDFRKEDGLHKVFYLVETDQGCKDSIEQEILFSPTFLLADEDYSQDFEGDVTGWSKEAGSAGQNSWKFETLTGAVFPFNAASGSRAWYTERINKEVIENSWVLTPCFNFEDYFRPMVSLDIKRSLDPLLEGAALQFTLDNGANWANIGKLNDGGQNWYNWDRIIDGPGQQGTGWTGIGVFDEDDQWYSTAHGLDLLTGEKEVRFRIAFGSSDRSVPVITNNGFAFDNFRILKRTRLTLLEYFTNANESKTEAADDSVKQLWLSMPADVIDVQYHTEYPSADRMNRDNPIPASNRGLFYGNSKVPFALLDGGPYDNYLGYDRKYDYAKRYPTAEDIHSRSLTPPDFNINISVTQLEPSMILSIDLTALKTMIGRELTLYTLVVQDTIDDPEYTGSNKSKVFRNVARKLVEDASGVNFDKSWFLGDPPLTIPLLWSSISSWYDPSKISIVAFIQDDNTKEILQAATTRKYIPSNGTWEGGIKLGRKILLYPNPAPEQLNIYFEQRPDETLDLRIYNMSGRMVLYDRVPDQTMIHTVNVNQLPEGLYILELRTKNRGELYYRTKFFHNW